jgi:hypothetical protein
MAYFNSKEASNDDESSEDSEKFQSQESPVKEPSR